MAYASANELNTRHVVFAGSLQIRQSLESDEGKYECVAENSVGVVYSYGANLYVRGERLSISFEAEKSSLSCFQVSANVSGWPFSSALCDIVFLFFPAVLI